jgi:hypothetical protein
MPGQTQQPAPVAMAIQATTSPAASLCYPTLVQLALDEFKNKYKENIKLTFERCAPWIGRIVEKVAPMMRRFNVLGTAFAYDSIYALRGLSGFIYFFLVCTYQDTLKKVLIITAGTGSKR